MPQIITRSTTGVGATVKGSNLSNQEIDQNLIAINNEVIVDNYPSLRPTLNLDFVNTTTLNPLISFSRGSPATQFNSSGVLTTVGNNTPRLDYNPSTLMLQGLLIEEGRINSIRNNTMVGAVAGTPGTLPTNWALSGISGITSTVIGTGTINGITYLDMRVVGTPTISSYFNIIPDILIAGSSGQTWTGSFWASLVAGSLTNTNPAIEVRESDSSQGFLTNTTAGIPITSTLTRYSLTRTLNNASTAFVSVRLIWQVTNGLPVDFTLRIGLPQLEQGAFATSVIPTTTTALTRSADVASVNTLSPWFNQTEGTLFAEFTARLGVTQTPATFSGVGGIGYRVRKSGTNQYYAALRDGGSVKDIAITPSPALTEGQVIKVAVGVKLNDCALSGGGQSAVTQTSFSPMPTITDVNLGFTGTDGFALNGWFRRFTYYPRRLPNEQLQALTGS